jgi:hypothetical protein
MEDVEAAGVGVPGDAGGAADVEIAGHPDLEDVDLRAAAPLDEGAPRKGGDPDPIASPSEARHQVEGLALASPPRRLRVDVEDGGEGAPSRLGS